MAPQRGEQGRLWSGGHDDFDTASYTSFSQDIVQVDEQGNYPAVPAALRGISSNSLKAYASSERDSTRESVMTKRAWAKAGCRMAS